MEKWTKQEDRKNRKKGERGSSKGDKGERNVGPPTAPHAHIVYPLFLTTKQNSPNPKTTNPSFNFSLASFHHFAHICNSCTSYKYGKIYFEICWFFQKI